MTYNEILAYIEKKIGTPPRRFNFLDKLTWYKRDIPAWKWHTEDIKHSVYNWARCFEQGKLGWGYVIQANSLMFENSGKDAPNCPGEILVWTETRRSFDADIAGDIANKLFSLKGNSANITNQEEKQFAQHLEDEMMRPYGVKVPETITGGYKLRSTTIFYQRRHIPGGVLSNSFFPILYLETSPMAAVMVPYRFWPKDLLEAWKDE